MATGFSIEEERRGAGHRLALNGELDLAAAYDLETALSRLCGGRRRRSSSICAASRSWTRWACARC